MRNEPGWLLTLRRSDPERAARLERIGNLLEQSQEAIDKAEVSIAKLGSIK